MSLVIELSDEFVRAVRIPEAELAAEARKELALAFYARGANSLEKVGSCEILTSLILPLQSNHGCHGSHG